MQLTGPVFMLIFLPLSLPPVLLLRRHRALVLSLLSALWYLLAFYRAPFALLHIFLLVAISLCLTRLPQRRLAAGIGIGLAVAGWLAARILAEYTSLAYTYPAGLTLVCLGVISLFLDRASGAARPAKLAEMCSYLLFYPVLMLGPVLRFSQYLTLCESAEPQLSRFSTGIRFYLSGYIRRLAIAAPLLRALEEILAFDTAQLPLPALLLALLLAFLLLYFFLTGVTSMARGIAWMYGIELPQDHLPLFSAVLPIDLPESMLLSLGQYAEAYVQVPLTRRLTGRTGRMLAALAGFLFSVSFFRLRLSLFLLALPFLLLLLFEAYRGRPFALPRSRLLRVLLAVFSALLCAIFAIGLILPEPMQFFALLRGGFSRSSYEFYYIYGSLSDAHYLPILLLTLAAIVPLSRLSKLLSERFAGRTAMVLRITENALLLLGFCFTFLYFMPQFPISASQTLSRLYI